MKCNASLLRLVEAYFEAAPQLMLQCYIIIQTKEYPLFTGIKMCFG